jgi:hypothetical protein
VGIKILPIRVYPKVTCKLVGKKWPLAEGVCKWDPSYFHS